MQPPTIQSQLLKAQFPTQMYSPRTTYSNYLKEIQHLKTNMIINIDKYILGNLKTEFEKRNKELTMVEFMYFSKKFLKDWNIELEGRDVKMQECLNELWQEIDKENRGKIIWEEFNSKIIETSLNLKSLSNNAGIQAPTFTEFGVPIHPSKYESPISKIVYINKKHKMAYFREESTLIEFFPIESSSLPNSIEISQTKPILLPQQELKVETMFKVKEKHENNQLMEKSTKGLSKIIKKDIKVSSYKNTVLDAIYLNDLKYDMLLVSCSDKHIRGYNVENLVPIIACQPENEDEPMIHQFPVEIYNMAWDEINEVLYATSKGSTIYQWMVKTDSEREMFDFKGHHGMISTIFMMSKLQLLASGGFDGRLILWDTVGQSVKMKYEEHTRAISAITFHEGLVLLFTSALDHKICVWNPYIGSLIHKIDNSLNIVQLEIIPNTSYLMSVDSGGNVKVREINRFTQIVNFSIFRSENIDETEKIINNTKSINSEKDKEINITMCSKRDNPILYYFGTDKIVGYKFNEIEKTSLNNNTGTIIEMKYSSKEMKLYTPMKNHIIVWNLLTGINEDTFYDITEYDITAFELVEDLGFFVVGDTDGNVLQRRIINGSLISKLPKMKAPVKNINIYELERNEGQKNPQSITRQYHLFCTTEEGDILVHKCSPKGEFEAHRHFSLRNDFSILNNNISTIDYYSQKYILIIVLSTNEIVCIDVEKRSLLVKISLGDHLFEKMNVVQSEEKNYFLIVNTKHGQLMPFYLPPHNKKFKNAPLLTSESKEIIECSIYGPKIHTYFMVNENYELLSFDLSTKLLDSSQSQELPMKWKIKLEQRVIEMLLIEHEEILIILNQSENFTFISTETGKIICHLSLEEMKDQFSNHTLIEPIFYFKPKTNEILISTPKEKIIKIEDNSTDPKMRIEKIIDPYYFINLLEQKNIDNFNKISNPSWTLNFNLPKIVEKRINEINSIEDKINNFTKNTELNGLSHFGSKIEKALELQKKWEKEKDNEPQQEEIENHQMLRKVNSVGRKSSTKFDISAFDKMMNQVTRGNSVSSLWKHAEKPKKYSEFSVHTESKAKESRDGSKLKKFSHVEEIDFFKLQKDPLYRLGLALKNVNTRDRQAENFIELAKKKEEVKLPKISSQKIKL